MGRLTNRKLTIGFQKPEGDEQLGKYDEDTLEVELVSPSRGHGSWSILVKL